MSTRGNKKFMSRKQKLLKKAKEMGLNETQFDDINRAFCLFDKDGNGKIRRTEVSAFFHALGRPMTSRDIDVMMAKADSSGSGCLEFHEFLPLIAGEYLSQEEQEIKTKETFRSFDQNGDGVISAREFRSAMAKMGRILSDAQLADCMRGLDKDGDGVITYDEFAKFVGHVL